MAHASRDLGYDIEIKVGDKELDMLPFVKEIIGNSILGMLDALKGIEADKEIEIKIKREFKG